MARRGYKVGVKLNSSLEISGMRGEGFVAERRIIPMPVAPFLSIAWVIVSAGKTLKPYLLGRNLRDAQQWIYKQKGTMKRFRKINR